MSTRDELQEAMDRLGLLIATYNRPANDDNRSKLIVSKFDGQQTTTLKITVEDGKFRFG